MDEEVWIVLIRDYIDSLWHTELKARNRLTELMRECEINDGSHYPTHWEYDSRYEPRDIIGIQPQLKRGWGFQSTNYTLGIQCYLFGPPILNKGLTCA